MIGETSQLIVDMLYKSNLPSGVAKDEAALKGLNTQSKTAGTHMTGLVGSTGKASTAMAGFGGALGHAKGKIAGLVSGPLGLIGLSAGLFSLGGLMAKSVERARDFGAEVSKLSKLTGLTVETTSALAAALEHFGVGSDAALRSIGFLEKNVGLLAARKDGLAKFGKEFSFALTDANGHIKDANALLLQSADYFNNKSIPATTKAAALAKLYGRSWQALIPFLAAGSKGIRDAEAAAAELGLTLNRTNVQDLAKFKESTRELNTAMGGLELQVGLALVPALNDLTKAATTFISKNRDGIVAGFKAAAGFAAQLGHAINATVVPAIGAIAGAWDKIPRPLKDLLIGGFVANKASKFLFNVGIGDILKGSGILQRGGTPANPLFVSDVLGGGGKNLLPTAAAGGLGLASKVFLVGEAIGLAVLVNAVKDDISARNTKLSEDLKTQTDAFIKQTPSRSELLNSLAGVNQGIKDLQSNPLLVLVQGDALKNLQDMRDALTKQLALTTNPTTHPGGVDSPRTYAASAALIDAILKRGRAAGFHPTTAAAEATNQKNQLRAANVQKRAADRQVSAALIMIRAAERLSSWSPGGGTRTPDHHTLSSPSRVLLAGDSGSERPHASGLAYVPWDNYRARLHKGEMVVPARQASQIRSGGPVSVTVNVPAPIMSIRDTNTAQDVRRRWGKTPTQVGAQ